MAETRIVAPVVNVTPEPAQDPNEYDVNALTMSLGGNEDANRGTKEYDVNDLTMNPPPYIPKLEDSSLSEEWKNRAKHVTDVIGRHTALALKGATPSLAATEAGFSAGGPVGGMIGSVALPFGDLLNTGINKVFGTHLKMPSQVAEKYLTAGVPEPTTESERMAHAGGAALGGTTGELSALTKLTKEATTPVGRQLAQQLSEKAGTQLASSAPIGAGSEYILDRTGSPTLAMLFGGLTGAATGLRATRRSAETTSHEDLLAESQNLYNKAQESGISFNAKSLESKANNFANELRAEGYTPNGYPKIAAALEEMKNPATPKDFTELSALRKMIQGAQKSSDAEERRIASILKDHFDDYVLNAGGKDLNINDPQGLQAWKDARGSYSKLKKAEIFDDMISNAELDKSKYTQSGMENSLAMQLRNLAKNDKKMRMFTKDEQEAIIEAAKGGNAQNIMRFMGKFAPTSVVGGIFTGELASKLPVIGPAISTGTIAAKNMASQQRAQDVINLADMMRLGRKPKLESRLKDVPTQTLRGIASEQAAKEQQ